VSARTPHLRGCPANALAAAVGFTVRVCAASLCYNWPVLLECKSLNCGFRVLYPGKIVIDCRRRWLIVAHGGPTNVLSPVPSELVFVPSVALCSGYVWDANVRPGHHETSVRGRWKWRIDNDGPDMDEWGCEWVEFNVLINTLYVISETSLSSQSLALVLTT